MQKIRPLFKTLSHNIKQLTWSDHCSLQKGWTRARPHTPSWPFPGHISSPSPACAPGPSQNHPLAARRSCSRCRHLQVRGLHSSIAFKFPQASETPPDCPGYHRQAGQAGIPAHAFTQGIYQAILEAFISEYQIVDQLRQATRLGSSGRRIL